MFPPCAIRTLPGDGRSALAFGSCRVSLPTTAVHAAQGRGSRGREIDALYALALRMRQQDPDQWPHVLLWLGDQVYADEVSPGVRAFIDERRGTTQRRPSDEVADFEEYARLYRESWRDPAIRWLLSTVSSSMIFDDHDVHDDWNTSWAWVARDPAQALVARADRRRAHVLLGLPAPRQPLPGRARGGRDVAPVARAAEDVTEPLRAFAERADREDPGTRWSYSRDFGRTRLIVMDSRAGRVLDGPRGRWSTRTSGTGSSSKASRRLRPPAARHVAALPSRPRDPPSGGVERGGVRRRLGRPGREAGRAHAPGPRPRALGRVQQLVPQADDADRGGRPRGAAARRPATIVALSGDVHHAYLAEAGFPGTVDARSRAYQAVCSPYRNPLGNHERFVIRRLCTGYAARVTQALARSAGRARPGHRVAAGRPADLRQPGGDAGAVGPQRVGEVRAHAAGGRQPPGAASHGRAAAVLALSKAADPLHRLAQPVVRRREGDAEEALAVGPVGAAGRDHDAGLLEHVLAVRGRRSDSPREPAPRRRSCPWAA